MHIYRQNTNVTINCVKTDIVPCTVDNILHLYDISTPEEKAKDWYKEANIFAQNLSAEYSISLDKVIAVIAAISPQQRWEVNMKNAKIACKVWWMYQRGLLVTLPAVHRFSSNSNKAYAILAGDSYSLGQKVDSFAANIAGDYNRVTVDSLAISIPLGFYELPGTYKFSNGVYKMVENLYQTAASMRNITPAIMQAVTWEKCRQIKTECKYNTSLLTAYLEVGNNPVDILSYIKTVG